MVFKYFADRMVDPRRTNTKDLQPKKKKFNFIPYVLIFCIEYCEVLYFNIYENAQTQTEPADLIDNASVIIKIAGAIFAGILMQVCGRKKSIQLSLMMIRTGAIFMYFVTPDRLIMFFIGYLTLQFAAGLEICAIIYVAETCSPEKRNFLLSLLIPARLFGKCVPCYLQRVLPNLFQIFFIIIVTSLSFYALKFCPESPCDTKDGGSGGDAGTELKKENGRVDEESETNSNSKSVQQNDADEESTFMEEFMTCRTLNTSANIFGLFWLYYLTVPYLYALMDNITRQDFAPETGPTHVHGVNTLDLATLIAAIVGTLMTRQFSVKTVMYVSGAGYCLACASGSLYEFAFFGVEGQYKPTRFCLIPVVCVWLAQGFLTTGIGIPTIIMLGEKYPPQIRGFASGLMWAIIVLPAYVAEKLVAQTNDIIPFWVMFILCGLCGLKMLCLSYDALFEKLIKLFKNEKPQQNVT